jgi:hypothetical protein
VVENWRQLRVETEAQALVAMHRLEGDGSHLLDPTLFTEVKKHLNLVIAATLKPIRDYESVGFLLQAQATPMQHGIRQSPIPGMVALHYGKLLIVLYVFGLAGRRKAPEKTSTRH